MDFLKLFTGGFPLTIERVQFLQNTYNKALSQLSAFYGLGENELGVLNGAKISTGASTVISDGIAIYNGEVIEVRGAEYSSGDFILVEEITEVPYNEDTDNDGNLDLKEADTVRYLTTVESGATGTAITISGAVKYLPTLQQIMPQVGEVKMWRGLAEDVPAGWQIIDEMEGRFAIGMHSTDSARNLNNDYGGTNRYITKEQLPSYNLIGNTGSAGSHRHDYVDGYFIESSPAGQDRQDQFDGYSAESVGNGFKGNANTDTDNSHIWTKDRNTGYVASHLHSIVLPLGGSGQTFSVLSDCKAMYYIEFVGF